MDYLHKSISLNKANYLSIQMVKNDAACLPLEIAVLAHQNWSISL